MQWTDAIVQTSMTVVPDPCGAYTHELYDATSGSPLALDVDVFPSEDLASSTKSLTVATTDFAKAARYTL